MSATGSYSTIIVGGGIAGVSLSYFLAAGGVSDIAVLEAHQLGSGCTGGSFGGVRQQFSTELEIELSKRAIRFWRTLEQVFESPCPFSQSGYLFVTSRPEILAKLEHAAQLQRQLGAGPVHILTPDGVRQVTPWLGTDDLIGGCWTPEDGHAVPSDGLAAIASRAAQLGVEFHERTAVAAIDKKPGSDIVVRSSSGDFRASTVVVAAGYSTPKLLWPFGLDLPITPWPFHFALTGPGLQGVSVPLVLDLDTGWAVEREGVDALRLTVSVTGLPREYGPTDMLYDFAKLAKARAPGLHNLRIVKTGSWEADASGDGHPFVGEVEKNLWVLAGFAGHGTMHGPVVAELLARKIMRDNVGLDVAQFDPHRALAGGGEWMVGARRD